ncbi:oligosaccharide flippase family protein [Candidatus Peregrinibacteria bacterium]|nr:oligosaccharide flippase family protein [Candidatus Peregrinibacteria bacterium]
MSVARKILSNTVWQFAGKVGMAFLGLAVVKIATHYLSVEGYGEYVLVYEFLAFFGIAADLGLFTIAVREMSKNEDDIPKIIGNILSLRTILVVATMLIAVLLAFLIPDYRDSRIPLGITIASITVFLTIINGTLTSVLQTKLQMHAASIASILGKAISVGFMVYIVFFAFPDQGDIGFFMLIGAGILGAIVTLLTTGYYVRKITPISYRFDIDLWKKVLKEALPYGLALILNTIYFRVDSILISVIRGQEEVGIYGVAMKMLEHFAILPLYFMNSVLPVLTKSLDEKTKRYKQIISQAFNFLAAMAVPMVVGGVILAYPIIFIVSTPEFLSRLNKGFVGSDIAFQILIFALLFQFLNVLFAFILIAVNRQVKLLYINAVCVVFNLIANLIFIPYYGFIGAAVTSVLSEMFILFATYYYARKYLEFRIDFGKAFKIILSSLLMGASIYYLKDVSYELMQNWNVLILIPFGMFVYGGMLFATKTIDKDMIQLLKKGESKPHDGNGKHTYS